MSVDWIVNDLLHYYDHHEKMQCPHSRVERGPQIWCSLLIVLHLATGRAISHPDLQTCHTSYFQCMLGLEGAFRYMYMSGNISSSFVDSNFVSQGIESSKEKCFQFFRGCSLFCNNWPTFFLLHFSVLYQLTGTSWYFRLMGMIETRTISQQMPMPALMSEEKNASTTSTTSRQRPGSACEECRRRKLRCDRQPQCGNCVEAGVVCTTTTVRPARGPKKGHLKALKGRIGIDYCPRYKGTMLTGI